MGYPYIIEIRTHHALDHKYLRVNPGLWSTSNYDCCLIVSLSSGHLISLMGRPTVGEEALWGLREVGCLLSHTAR
jgi:hypothetical protein